MPIRAVVSPKFCYAQTVGQLAIRRAAATSDSYKNGMFDYSDTSSMDYFVLTPLIAFPNIGNGHSARKGNRITVTSIRVKLHFSIKYDRLSSWSFFSPVVSIAAGSNLPLNPTAFLKFRLFLISVDDDIEVTKPKLLNWFYATHCLYRNPNVAEVLKGPSATAVTECPGPTSVHSNVLRTTTDWTGKFNVLADRKFTMSAKHPAFDIDMTVPLRKEFVYDEVYTTDSKLLYPKLYLFILPPLSYEVDCDPATFDACKNTDTTSNVTKPVCSYYSWSKLNFVDL